MGSAGGFRVPEALKTPKSPKKNFVGKKCHAEKNSVFRIFCYPRVRNDEKTRLRENFRKMTRLARDMAILGILAL